jgi:hypothetical protein
MSESPPEKRKHRATGRPKGGGPGPPVTVGASEAWFMRVNPEFHATLKRKAADWGVPASVLVRLVLEKGFEEELFEPPEPGEMLRDRIRRERKERSARREGPEG